MRSGFRICRSPAEQPSDDYLLRIYRQEPDERLWALQQALETERRTVKTSEAFCVKRLPLIALVLQERRDARGIS